MATLALAISQKSSRETLPSCPTARRTHSGWSEPLFSVLPCGVLSHRAPRPRGQGEKAALGFCPTAGDTALFPIAVFSGISTLQ